MKVISTTNAPGAIGPYSQGFVANGMVFTSGQIPIDPATGEMPEGIKEQAEECDRYFGSGGIRSREGDQDDMFSG